MSSRITYNGRVLAVANSQKFKGISARKELVVLSDAGLLFRVTLWGQHEKTEIPLNSRVDLRRFQICHFLGECLKSMSFSQIIVEANSISATPSLSPVTSLMGGFRFDPISSIKERVSDDKPSFGYIRGLFDSYDRNLSYNACVQCRKRCEEMCTQCETIGKPSLRLTAYLEVDTVMAKITFFEEPLNSLFGCQMSKYIETEEGLASFRHLLDQLSGQEIGLHVMAKKVSFVEEEQEVSFIQYTARVPVFCFGQKIEN
jgi:hypothetical protein